MPKQRQNDVTWCFEIFKDTHKTVSGCFAALQNDRHHGVSIFNDTHTDVSGYFLWFKDTHTDTSRMLGDIQWHTYRRLGIFCCDLRTHANIWNTCKSFSSAEPPPLPATIFATKPQNLSDSEDDSSGKENRPSRRIRSSNNNRKVDQSLTSSDSEDEYEPSGKENRPSSRQFFQVKTTENWAAGRRRKRRKVPVLVFGMNHQGHYYHQMISNRTGCWFLNK